MHFIGIFLYNESGDKMKKTVTVKKDICIGCGSCFGSYPECFEMTDEGLAKVKENLTEEELEEAVDAIDICPVGAITEDEEEEN